MVQWQVYVLPHLDFNIELSMTIFYDNMGTIGRVKNPIHHSRTIKKQIVVSRISVEEKLTLLKELNFSVDLHLLKILSNSIIQNKSIIDTKIIRSSQ